jgi:peptidoglycan/xylan/chitin deacetylase (PgdA/CDA1 family)
LTRRSAGVLARVTGVPPVGIRTPSWEFTPATLGIVRELGLLYDSSLMADDEPYELLQHGEPIGVVELPVEWIRDDAIYFNMRMDSPLRPYMPPASLLDIWKAEFEGAVTEGGLFLLTMHPHVIGHRSRLALLEALLRHLRATPGVWFATHAEVARYVKEAPRASNPG